MTVASMRVGPLIPVSDIAKSRAFYEDTLGFRGQEVPGGVELTCGDGTTAFLLDGPSYAGTAEWPLATFRSPNLEVTVGELGAIGVPLEQVHEDGMDTDDRGIAEMPGGGRIAWIRDPDNQVLSIFEPAV